MEYLRTDKIEVEGKPFIIQELSHNQYNQVVALDDQNAAALLTVKYGVPEFADKEVEEVGDFLPMRFVVPLSIAIVKLSSAGDDPEGN